MKHMSYKLLWAASILLCANFSSETSTTGRQKNKINFCGTLTDSQGNTINIENISISGMWERIPVYQKPKSPDVKPDINTTRIDLQEVAQIKLPSPEPIISKFKNREYIDIVVIYNDDKRTAKPYIVELSKKILCDEINEAGPIEKEVSFQALGTLTITGYSYRTPDDKNNKKHQRPCKADKNNQNS